MVDVHSSARDYALALAGLKQRHWSKSNPTLSRNITSCVYVSE